MNFCEFLLILFFFFGYLVLCCFVNSSRNVEDIGIFGVDVERYVKLGVFGKFK